MIEMLTCDGTVHWWDISLDDHFHMPLLECDSCGSIFVGTPDSAHLEALIEAADQ